LATGDDDRETEVDEFDLSAAFLDQDVVKFDVPVHYVVLVQVSHTLSNLLENASSSRFSNNAIGHGLGVLLQRDPLDVIRNNEYLLRCVDQVMESDDARVVQSFEYCDFSLSCLAFHWVGQPVLLVDFDGVLLLVTLGEAESYCSVGALADYPTHVVGFKLARGVGAG